MGILEKTIGWCLKASFGFFEPGNDGKIFLRNTQAPDLLEAAVTVGRARPLGEDLARFRSKAR